MAEDVGNIGGLLTPREDLIPNIQSAYGAIIQNAPDYQYFTAPLSNQGRTTASYGTQNNIVVAPDTQIRLVNNATGEVAFVGSGYGGAQQAIDAANALSSSAGKNANWDIQVTRPGSTNFETVSTERPDVSGLGIAADLALPTIGAILAGPLGAAAGSGVSSVAQGRSIEDALLRAAIAGGSTYLGGQLFGPASTTTNAAINADLIPNALSGLNFGSIASTAIPAGVGGAVGAAIPTFGSDIIVNALGQVVPNLAGAAGSLATNLVPNFFDSAQLNNISSPPSNSATETAKNTGEATTTGPDLTLTARTPTSLLPAGLATGAAATAATAANATGATNTQADRITPTAAETAALNAGATSGGVLGTGLSATQLATLGSLGASALGSLFGGSGGTTGAGTPYVSPFGAGGTMAGGDFRANPNIQNYEQYGFGGEASFFRPEYYGLVSSGSKMGYTPPAGTTTPKYTPLIGGGSTTPTVTPSVTPTSTPTPPPPPPRQERPEGWTGVVSGQQVGDTQVVDGTTWQWGGDNVGWQMQYKNPETGNIGLLGGNGATNVSSFKNNPTVAVNQPYFAQNTANIPGWATTYQGFQRGLMDAGITGDQKAAAERELFTAIETQPFTSPTALVDYAKGIYTKYTSNPLQATAQATMAGQPATNNLTAAGRALYDWQMRNNPNQNPQTILDYVNSLNDYQRLGTYATLAGITTNADQIRQTNANMSSADILKEYEQKTGIKALI